MKTEEYANLIFVSIICLVLGISIGMYIMENKRIVDNQLLDAINYCAHNQSLREIRLRSFGGILIECNNGLSRVIN